MGITITPPRFWVVYLSCLEKPRSLKEISREIGYSGFSALYQNYQGRPLVDWMLENKNYGHPFLRMAEKKKREIKYEAVMESLLPDDEMDFWKSGWVKGAVFSLENIKILFEVKKYKHAMMERLGGEFLRAVNSILLNMGMEMHVSRGKRPHIDNLGREELVRRRINWDIMSVSFANLNLEGYIKAMHAEEHKKEIMSLFMKRYGMLL